MELRSGARVPEPNKIYVSGHGGKKILVTKLFVRSMVAPFLPKSQRDGRFRFSWIPLMYQLMDERKVERPEGGFKKPPCNMSCRDNWDGCPDECAKCNMFLHDIPMCPFSDLCEMCEYLWESRLQIVSGNITIENEPWHFCPKYHLWRRGHVDGPEAQWQRVSKKNSFRNKQKRREISN